MSQYTRIVTSGNMPPDVPLNFTTDSGSAVPAANNINIFGIDSTDNNDNGISTSGSGATVNVILTNRVTGGISTIGDTPTTALTFSLGATPGVYYVNGDVVAYNLDDIAGSAFSFSGAYRTTGAAATEIAIESGDEFKEAAMAATDIAVNASGNDIIVTVTGLAAKDINWNVYLTYRFVS